VSFTQMFLSLGYSDLSEFGVGILRWVTLVSTELQWKVFAMTTGAQRAFPLPWPFQGPDILCRWGGNEPPSHHFGLGDCLRLQYKGASRCFRSWAGCWGDDGNHDSFSSLTVNSAFLCSPAHTTWLPPISQVWRDFLPSPSRTV
jgi:hypothetical protein